jgi:hypothetical protein
MRKEKETKASWTNATGEKFPSSFPRRRSSCRHGTMRSPRSARTSVLVACAETSKDVTRSQKRRPARPESLHPSNASRRWDEIRRTAMETESEIPDEQPLPTRRLRCLTSLYMIHIASSKQELLQRKSVANYKIPRHLSNKTWETKNVKVPTWTRIPSSSKYAFYINYFTYLWHANISHD